METISRKMLVEMLNNVEKGTFCFVSMETILSMNKKNNPYFEKVIKRTNGNYYLGGSYQQRVNNNMIKEGIEPTFESEKPTGKHHVSKVVLRDDKTDTIEYLMLEPFENIKTKKTLFFEGREITDPIELELIKSFEKKRSESIQGGQEKKVLCITPKIENIREIHFNKHKYQVID